jgi:hypothetical protein
MSGGGKLRFLSVANISLITYCKGRHLEARQYVPAALGALGPDDELVFVDYDDGDGIGCWVESLANEHISVVRVTGLPFFHVNHARNLGLRAAVGGIVIFSDVDFLVSPEMVQEARHLGPLSWLCQPGDVSSWGFIVCRREDAMEVGGFDEAFVGYGCDDMFFRGSLTLLGRACHVMQNRLVPVVRCGEQVRLHGVSQNLSAALNGRLGRGLRMLHRYRQNVSRNWGWGGLFLCKSKLRTSVDGAAYYAKLGA